MSARAMASILGISRSTAYRDAVGAQDPAGRYSTRGIDGKLYPGPGSRRDQAQMYARILTMHGDGHSMRKIAAAVGCSVGTVHHVSKNYRFAEDAT